MSDFKYFSEKNKNFSFSTTTSLIRKIAANTETGSTELFELLKFLKNKVGVNTVGFDHVRSVENDVFNVPKEIYLILDYHQKMTINQIILNIPEKMMFY